MTPWVDPRTRTDLSQNPNSRLELGQLLIRLEEAQIRQQPRQDPKEQSVYERDDNMIYVGGFDGHISP